MAISKRLSTVLGLAAVTLAGCLGPGHEMKSLLGRPSADLIARWGPPSQKAPDGSGGEVWTYFVQRQWTTPGQADTTISGTGHSSGNIYGTPYGATYSGDVDLQGNATTTWTPAQTHGYTGHRTFFINAEGMIYRYGWRGL